MFPIERSAFLNALGTAIGNSLWQLAALWLLYSAITSLVKMNAALKYRLAIVASMFGFVTFIITFFFAFVTAPQQESVVNTFAWVNETVDQSSFANQFLYYYHSFLASLKTLSPYISCGYLLIFIVLGIRLINGFRQVHFFATKGLGKVDVEWRLFVQKNAGLLQIAKPVKVFTSRYVQSPLTMGFWKPVILLPLASLNNLTSSQLEAILLHELAHIRRHDYLVNIFVQVAENTLFFNPFMRLLLKQVRLERENCCDDYVLQFQYSPRDYAKALLAIEQNNAATLLALSARNKDSFQLLNRVRRMVAPQPHSFNYKQQLYLLLLLTILGLGLTVIIPKPKKKSPVVDKTMTTKSVLQERMDDMHRIAVPEAGHTPVFNLIRKLQGVENGGDNLDLAAIEARGRDIGEQAEAIYKSQADENEKNIRPVIEQATKWAEALNDSEALEKMAAAAKKFENAKFADQFQQLSNIDQYISELLPAIKTNDLQNMISRITFNQPDLKTIPGFEAGQVYMPQIKINTITAPLERINFRKLKDEQDKNQQKLRERDQEQLKEQRRQFGLAHQAVITANRQLTEQDRENLKREKEALEQMISHTKNQWFQYDIRLDDIKSPAPAAIKDTDDEFDTEPEDASTSVLQAEIKNLKTQIAAYAASFPVSINVNHLNGSLRIRCNTRDINREKDTKLINETRFLNVPDIPEINKNTNFDIEIHQETQTKDGKEANVMVVKIIHPDPSH